MKIDLKKIAPKILPCMTYGVFGMSFFCSAYFLWMGIENIYIHKKTFETDVDEIVYKIDYIIAPLIIVFFTSILPILLYKKKKQTFALFAALACFFLFVFWFIDLGKWLIIGSTPLPV
jgi:threonine/homoserine/homoserine lactone efflux protein